MNQNATTTARRVMLAGLALALVLSASAVWWKVFRTEPVRLVAPLSQTETYPYEVGTPVFLDEDQVGRVVATGFTDGTQWAELHLDVTSSQHRKLKEGLARVVGTRAIGLTSEFIDSHGVPLMDGDTVAPVTPSERQLRRWGLRFEKWLLPVGSAGAFLLLRRLFRR